MSSSSPGSSWIHRSSQGAPVVELPSVNHVSSRVNTTIRHVVALSRYAVTYSRSWVAESSNERVRLKAEKRLNVQVPRFQRVLLNKLPPGFDFVAHEDSEEVVGGGRVFHGDLKEGAVLGVESGLAELFRVHFA